MTPTPAPTRSHSIRSRTGSHGRFLLVPCLALLFAPALVHGQSQPAAPPSAPTRPELPGRRPAAAPIEPPGVAPGGGATGGATGGGESGAAGTTEPVADAPKPKEIIDKHIKAIGGEEALRKQTSRSQTLVVSIQEMPNVTSRLDVKAKAPNRYVASLSSPMGEVQQGFDGKIGWMMAPGQGAELLTGKQLSQMKLEAEFFRELNLMDHFTTAETLGQREFAGARCWHVRFSGGENDATSYFFDQATGLLRGYEAQISTPMGDSQATMTYLEWKDVDGVKHPAKMQQAVMGMNQIVVVEKLDVAELPDSVFKLPMPVQAILDRQKESSDPAKAPPVEPK